MSDTDEAQQGGSADAGEDEVQATGPQPILQVLHQIRDGYLVEQLSDAMARVVGAVQRHEAPGELTLTLKLKPQKRTELPVLMVSYEIKEKLPKPPALDTLFFTTPEGGHLTRENPYQRSLELRPVDGHRGR